MERLLPPQAVEPAMPRSETASGLRVAAYTLLTLMLLGAAWVRFNDQIEAAAPPLAGPAAAVADHLADSGRLKGLLQAALLPASAETAAVAEMGLTASEARQLSEALQRRRLRLVRLPLVDLTPTAREDGRPVRVAASGYTRLVTLSHAPAILILPVGPVATVSFSTPSTDGVAIGAVTLSGLTSLPPIVAGQTMNVGILAQ